MNVREINEAIENGISLSNYSERDIEKKLLEIIEALDYLGLDFSFFQDSKMTAKIAWTLKKRYGFLKDQELVIILHSGCEGEFKRLTQSIKGFNLFSWVKEYQEHRQRALQNRRDLSDEDYNHQRYDVKESPVGQAMIWKMNNLKKEDWDSIPLDEIARVLKNKESMIVLAERYSVVLK